MYFQSRNALCVELMVCLSAQHASWLLVLVSVLIAFILCCFSSLKNLISGFSIDARYLLDTCLFYWDFWVCSQYLSINSSIHQANSLESLTARYLLNLLRSFCHRYLLDTSLSIEILFSIPSKSIELLFLYIYISIYMYIFEVWLDFTQTQISQSLSLFSFNPNHLFSPKTFFHSRFQPNPSLNPLVSVLYLFQTNQTAYFTEKHFWI